MANYHIKTNRAFTPIRKYGWLFTVVIALGGFWEPKLGLAVILIMIGLVITAFFSGRFWCGNICPHGSLFDSVLLGISKNKKIPKFFRSKVVVLSVFLFFMFSFSRKFISTFQFWGTYDFLDKLGAVFANTYFVVLIIGGGLAVFVNSRTWCQFCPMGTIQKPSHRLGQALGITRMTEKKVTISNKDDCLSCGKCAGVCPFQLTPYKEFSSKNQFDHVDCIKCSTCVVNCPVNILSLKTERDAVQGN